MHPNSKQKRGAKPSSASSDGPPSRDVSELENRFFAVAAAAVIVTGILAFLPHTNWWWGANLLAFHAVPARLAWVGLALAVLAALRFLPRRSVVPAEAPAASAAGTPGGAPPGAAAHGSPRPSLRTLPAILPALCAALAGGALFHLLRARSFLLGDGTHIVIHLARNEPPAPRAALYNILETEVTRSLRGDRNIPTLAEAGFLSTLVGALFLGIAAWLLARRARASGVVVAAALGLPVLLQPSMQLYFGYVEAYALLAAPLMIFFLLAFDVAERRRSAWTLVPPAALAMAAHPFGATTLPPLLLLLLRTDRRSALRRLVAAAAALAGVTVALFLVFRFWPAGRAIDSPVRFLAPQEYGDLLERVLRNIVRTPHWSRLYTTASASHWADVANHLWLTAAPALILLVAFAVSRSGRRALAAFPVAVAAAGSAGVILIRCLLRTVLGAARDWDLFAAAGIGLTATAAAALAVRAGSRPAAADGPAPAGVRAAEERGRAARLVAGAAVISVFFLAPWIGLQVDIDRAARRHLAIVDAQPALEPIAAGDYHAAMGDRFFFVGRYSLAGRAYDRAHALWPTYMHTLRAGQSYLASGELERAAVALHRALEERPDDRTAMAELGNVLNGLNAFALADSVLRRTIALYPEMPLARLHRTRTLAMMGRDREARAMLESARPLMKPGDPALADFVNLDTLIAGRPADAVPVPLPEER